MVREMLLSAYFTGFIFYSVVVMRKQNEVRRLFPKIYFLVAFVAMIFWPLVMSSICYDSLKVRK
jgi:uncharacterized membrane protein